MRSSLRLTFGCICIVSGLLLWIPYHRWLSTRSSCPVSVPMSLSIGYVRTSTFSINMTRRYVIAIEVKRRLPLSILNCMLGISVGPAGQNHCVEEPLIQANWVLWNDGRIVDHGYSDNDRDGGWGDTIERDIGVFNAEEGKRYVLVINVTKDGAPLAAADPHLIVRVTDNQIGAQGGIVFVFVFCFLEPVGLILVISSGVRCWGNRSGERAVFSGRPR